MQGEQSKIHKDILRRVVAHNDESDYDEELLEFHLFWTAMHLRYSAEPATSSRIHHPILILIHHLFLVVCEHGARYTYGFEIQHHTDTGI